MIQFHQLGVRCKLQKDHIFGHFGKISGLIKWPSILRLTSCAKLMRLHQEELKQMSIKYTTKNSTGWAMMYVCIVKLDYLTKERVSINSFPLLLKNNWNIKFKNTSVGYTSASTLLGLDFSKHTLPETHFMRHMLEYIIIKKVCPKSKQILLFTRRINIKKNWHVYLT